MYSTSSALTFNPPVKFEFAYVETFGIFVVEFLLPGSIYCFGALYVELWSRLSVPPENGLWFPVTAFSVWMLTNCCSRRLCKYLKTRRYEKVTILAITCLIVVAKTLFLSLGNHVGKFILQGLIEGSCTSILLTLIKISSSEYYQSDLSRFALLSQITRALSFLLYPLILEQLADAYGGNGAELIEAVILANILPASLLVICEFKEEGPQRVNTISESLFYKANNLNKDELVSDSWESNHSESDEGDELQFYTRKVTYNGIEILSVIEEESESRMTCSEIPKTNPPEVVQNREVQTEKIQMARWLLVVNVFLIYITKFTIVFIFITSLTLLPYSMEEIFLIQLISIAWFINTVGLSCVSTPKITKTILFLFGMFWSSCCFFYLTPYSTDMANRISLLFAFGFATIFHSESISEQILFKEVPEILKYLNGVIGISMILLYTLIYTLSDLNRDTLFLTYSILLFSFVITWIVIIISKLICKRR